MRLVVLSLGFLFAAGCALDRTGFGEPEDSGGAIDAGPLDAGLLDAGPPLDAGPTNDASPIDATVPVDSGIDSGVDAGGIDAGRDSGVDSGPPPPRSCDAIYGGLSSYQLCAERATECEMYVSLSNTSCDDACTSVGGTCIAAYAESGSDECTRSGTAESCSGDHNDEICICTRIP